MGELIILDLHPCISSGITSILSVLPVTAMAGVRHLLVASLFLVFLGDVSGDGDGLWGRQYVSSEMCYKPWSHCARKKGLTIADGECRLNVWVWVVIVLGSILILSVIACVCCGLFCYKPCMKAMPWNKDP